MDTAEPVTAAVHRTAAATAFSSALSSTSSSSFAVFASNEPNQLANNTSKATTSSPPSSSATVLVASTEYKECANCGVNDTPLWRKYNDHDLCNACGIYFRVNGFHRPFLPNMRKLLSSARKMGLSCVNCSTKITSMWRRTPEGESICNACGLYYRLNGVKRPVSMRKDWIRKRQRKTQQISGIMRLANQTILSTSVVEQQHQQQQQQQIGSVNSSGVSQQQQQQQQLLSIPQQESSSFDSNSQQQQLNQLNQSQCFQLVNGVHDVCSGELVQQQQQPDQHSSTQQNQENHYHHQKTFDYSLQYYDFGQTFQQEQQQQPMSDHHQHNSHEEQLQPLMNSSSLSYMPQQQHNSSATMNVVHSYNEQVPIECTNGTVYSSNTSYHHHHQEDIKEVVHHHHHHHHLQHQ